MVFDIYNQQICDKIKLWLGSGKTTSNFHVFLCYQAGNVPPFPTNQVWDCKPIYREYHANSWTWTKCGPLGGDIP
jgi:hypothetical protein